jgi:tripartite-type tricarboxylate transporter receptor subunit TctC
LPPDVPPARVAALRKAFDLTMKDPGFIAESQKLNLEIDPMTGEELAALVRKVNATSPAVVARVKEALRNK